ncbi:ATP-binding protein [Streptomyces sp. N2-109]|uniref:histidine kinase n=1 Tax=Streptomyces gossypii TaxID=2883101 RepID=A0ABT2K3J4_9ACTN|nr:ATP-binding protein [Streptomyces gossypii]MCT2594748.1 ATP-binding protein [Streptomyces gossypii]
MTEIPVALTVLLAVGTVAAVGMAPYLARTRGQLRSLRTRAATAETDLGNVTRHRDDLAGRIPLAEAEIRHLAAVRLPDLATALTHPHMSVRGPADPRIAGSTLDEALSAVLETVGESIDKERMRVDAAAQATMRSTSTTIQALLYQLQTLLQEMQERHDDPLLAQDLLAADFLNEQALRRIQTTAVVCGSWPGLTRQDSHVADIVVGATSRLQGYERIQVTSQLRDPVGVVARAVEPVAVALTELMANALHYSHTDLPVAVTVQQGNRGATVIIDDAGVGMHEDEVRRARQLMSGQDQVLLTELGDPVRSGFAAVGQLVRQYGFSVHVETSPYGGVRAIVHIPGEPLLTLLDEERHPLSPMTPLPASGPTAPRTAPPGPTVPGTAGTAGTAGTEPAAPAAAAESPAPPAAAEPAAPAAAAPAAAAPAAAAAEEAALPRRRRRQPEPQAAASPQPPAPPLSPPETAPEAEADAERSAERWGDFQRGTESGRAAITGDSAQTAAPAEAAGPAEPTDGSGPSTAPEGNPPS